jgi:hypothetical protein
MEAKKSKKVYENTVQPYFQKDLPEGTYEIAFKRWLVRQIKDGHLTRVEAIKQFNFNPISGATLLSNWIKSYSTPEELLLPSMTAEEKAEKQALEKRIKDLELQAAKNQMHIKALNTFIDIAEEQLKINIRKKSGTKQ